MEFPGSSAAAGGGALRLSSAFTADELEVAEILLVLAGTSDDSSRFPQSWGAKRRRSAIVNPPPATGKSDYSSNSPDSPLLFVSTVDSGSNRSTLQEVNRTKLSRDELMAENMKLQETEQLMHGRVDDGSDLLELRLMSRAEPSGISQSKEVGPKGIITIPDLNAPAEEFLANLERPQPSDSSHHQTAAGGEAAALARWHRRLIQKNKKARRGGK